MNIWLQYILICAQSFVPTTFITARNKVVARYCFTPVILFTGGSLSRGSLSMGVSVQGDLCQGDPLAGVRLRAGGMHPTGMYSCLGIQLLQGKF